MVRSQEHLYKASTYKRTVLVRLYSTTIRYTHYPTSTMYIIFMCFIHITIWYKWINYTLLHCGAGSTFHDSSKWWCQTNATNPRWCEGTTRPNSRQFQINHLSSSSSTRSWTINGHVKRSDQRVLICSCCSELRPATPRSHFWFKSISPLGCVSSVGPICSCSSDW